MKHVFLLPYFVIVLLITSACTTVKQADKLLSDDEYREKHCSSWSTKKFSSASMQKEYLFNECRVNGSSVLFFSIPETNEMLKKEVFHVDLDKLDLAKNGCSLGFIRDEDWENKNINEIYESCYVWMAYNNKLGIRRDITIETPAVRVTNPKAIEVFKRRSPLFVE